MTIRRLDNGQHLLPFFAESEHGHGSGGQAPPENTSQQAPQ
jgi:hypothetical protein